MKISQDELEFLKEIESDLDGDSARLVYADWLEDRGDPRSEYLRLEYELTSGNGTTRDLESVVARVNKLNSSIDPAWLALVSRSAIEGCYQHFDENRACPKLWRALNKTESPTIRICKKCKLSVQFCTNLNDASWFQQQHIRIAVESTLERNKDDLQAIALEQDEPEDQESLSERAIQGAQIAQTAFGNRRERSQRRWWRGP